MQVKNYRLLITDRFNVTMKSISHSYYPWFCSYSLPTFTLLELNRNTQINSIVFFFVGEVLN